MSEQAFDAHLHMLQLRGVDVPCVACRGSGVRVYGSTATWRGGIGGAAMTQDVCDRCWGSGDANRSWTDLRKLTARRREWEAEQCATWLAHRIGANLTSARKHLSLLADVIAAEAKKRKPKNVPDADRFWYAREAEALAAAIREVSGPQSANNPESPDGSEG